MFQVDDGLIVVSLLRPGAAARSVTGSSRRIESNGFVEISNCLVIIDLPPDGTTVCIGLGTSRIEPDRFVKIGGGFFDLSLFAPGYTAPEVGCRNRGIEPQGLGKIGDGVVILFFSVHAGPRQA